MKCNKCGEECNENQSVCMKCGNPIQIIPDLNLIEEELASNIGELMDEELEEDEALGKTKVISTIDDDYLRDSTFDMSDEMNIPDIKDESLELIEIAREHEAKMNLSSKKSSDGYQVNALNSDKKNQQRKEAEHKKKMKKIKIGIICVAAAILIVIAVIVVILMGKDKKPKESFVDIYNQGVDYYIEEDYDSAIDAFQNAMSLAETDKEKISVNESLYNTYMKKDIEDLSKSEIEECVDILKTLIELDANNVKHYKELLSLYQKAGMQDEYEEFKETLVGTEIGEELGLTSVESPVFSKEPGEYTEYITVEIEGSSDTDIYYTLDGSEPDKDSVLYEEPVEIKKQGEITLKAVAIDGEDKASEVVAAKYTIKLESIEAPVVTPESGTYTELTKIEVDVPDGMKAYYTIDEYGLVPDTDSEEYTEPIDMPRGKNVFSVILVDESGMSSAVTECIYHYEVDREYSYDEALDILKETLIDEGTIEDESGAMSNDSLMEFSYKEISIIENAEYYLIEGIYKSDTGKVIDTYLYGIDTVTGDFVIITIKDDEYRIKK